MTPMSEPSPTSPVLTRRELEVMTRITQGMTNDEIATDLYLSVNSIKTYARSAYGKVGVARRAHAVLWGVRNGLLESTVQPHGRAE